MTRKQRRFAFLAGGLTILAIAAALVLFALRDSIVVFYGPQDALTRLADGNLKAGQRVRLGGLVLPGSVSREPGKPVTFTITDGTGEVKVRYEGLLPDLFREGQGIVAQGAFDETKSFQAVEVLAKHDEKYMPPEVAEALKKGGHWKEGEAYPAQGKP